MGDPHEEIIIMVKNKKFTDCSESDLQNTNGGLLAGGISLVEF